MYESEAVGFSGDNFLNLVACSETTQTLASISSFLQQLESDLGRDPSQPKYSSRTMDIDILTYGGLIGEQDGVILPRDEILKHAFVLCPLADLLPAQLHPRLGVSFSQLWAEFDQDSQPLWPVEFDWQDAES